MDTEGDLQDHLLESSNDAVRCIKAHKPFWETKILDCGLRDQRWQEMSWTLFMCLDGLSWDAEKELFEIDDEDA